MPRPPRNVTPEEMKRLEKLRKDGAQARATSLTGSPDPQADILGAIAWHWAAVGLNSRELVDLLITALAGDVRWKQIAAACGIDPEDDDAVAVFRAAGKRRLRKTD